MANDIKSKKSQTSSITIIVAAVIGLIILVVIIAMISGKLGSFSKGAENVNTCDSLCKAAGYVDNSGSVDTVGLKDDANPPIQCHCKSA